MAAADSGAKPLQNAMKMAKVAIQLDGGNKHKVMSYTAWLQRQHGGLIPQEHPVSVVNRRRGVGSCLLAKLSPQHATFHA